jgi:hypothetical protein
MSGAVNNEKIGFLNIPSGMDVYLVGIGEQDGRLVSFIEKYTTGAAEMSVSNLQETTVEAFKQQLSLFDQ